MARIKRKFNTKLLKRFNKKELTNFMKKHKLPVEKALSIYTKAEIVSQLIRLQRSSLYYDAFQDLKIKPARELSVKQRQNLETARGRLNNLNIKTKQAFPQMKKIDAGRPVENAISTKVGVDNQVEQDIILASATLVNQQPSQLEQIKEGDSGTLQQLEEPIGRQFNSLEELFVFSDRNFSSQKKRVIDLIIKRKQEKGIEIGQSGKQPGPQEGIEELPSVITDIISEQSGRVDSDFLIVVNKLSVAELKEVLDEAQIGRRGLTRKAQLSQVVAANKTKTNQIVNLKIKIKQESRLVIEKEIQQRTVIQEGQVVKDNEGAKHQADKRNVLPQGDNEAVQNVINKNVGNLDKSKKSRRKIVVKN